MSQRLRPTTIWPRPEQHSGWLSWAQELTKILVLKREIEFRGALVTLTSAPLVVATAEEIEWETAEYDTDALWTAASPTRLTVPRGVRLVRLFGAVVQTAAVKNEVFLLKNSSAVFAGAAVGEIEDLGTSFQTPVLKVLPGDYFEVSVDPASSVSLAVQRTWFAMEICQ